MEAVQAQHDVRRVYVLVVDDDPWIRYRLADGLRDVGVNVVEAASADEALVYLRNEERCDLVFTDIQMPGSMDGVKLAELLKKGIPDLPIILTSGMVDPGDVSDLGLFMPKPYELEEAVAWIFELLGIQEKTLDQ